MACTVCSVSVHYSLLILISEPYVRIATKSKALLVSFTSSVVALQYHCRYKAPLKQHKISFINTKKAFKKLYMFLF